MRTRRSNNFLDLWIGLIAGPVMGFMVLSGLSTALAKSVAGRNIDLEAAFAPGYRILTLVFIVGVLGSTANLAWRLRGD